MQDKILDLNDVGEQHYAAGDKDAALRCFNQVIADNPRHAEAHNNLGVIAYEQGDVARAKDCFLSALKYDPHSKDALLNLGELLLDGQHPSQALALYDAYLREHPQDNEVLAARRELSLEDGDGGDLPVGQVLQTLSGLEQDLSVLHNNGEVPWREQTARRGERDTFFRKLGEMESDRLAFLQKRFTLGLDHLKRPLNDFLNWLVESSEATNFTYDLSDINKAHLAWFTAQVTGLEKTLVDGYIRELVEDTALRDHIRKQVQAGPERAVCDQTARYGRRLGWYALVRALKPRVVVESGIDKGLGTCVLAAAVMKNREEGHGGLVYGLDIDPKAGFLFIEPYRRYGKILCGDAAATLETFEESIDLFIHDSNHDPLYERKEYQTVQPKLSERGVVISDNAHGTMELMRFAERTGRRFLYFQEKPLKHFYSGSGIGVAWNETKTKGREPGNRNEKQTDGHHVDVS